tara:strand:+ start:406 stop:747 length:342 start_codon:yes stop_codon:yes gene_type:complete
VKKFLATTIHIILVLGVLILCTSKLNGNQSKVEMIPFRVIPTGDITCPIGIEIIQPITMLGVSILYNDELEEIIMDRAIFEVTNPFAQNEIFEIDGKSYYLLRIPYTGVIWRQ